MSTTYSAKYVLGHFTIVTNNTYTRLMVDVDVTLDPSGTPVVMPRTQIWFEAVTPGNDDLGITYQSIKDACTQLCYSMIANYYPQYANWPGEGQTGHSSATNTLAQPKAPEGSWWDTVSLTY